MQQWFIDL